MNWLKSMVKQREFMIFMIVSLLFIVMIFASPYFLSTGNILAVLLGLSLEAIIAVAMAHLMVSGGFDMSVGSVVAFTGAMTALMLKAGVPIPMALLIGLLIGGAIGFFNGFIIAKVGINPFVTTLSSLSLFRGLTLIVTKGQNITGLPDAFKAIGQAKIFGIQTPILIAAALIIVGDIYLRKSRFFRQSYYIGGNEQSARLSGIPVDKMKILAYVLTGLFAAISGIVMTARLGSASVTAGTGMELRVITAVIIGGASLQGGEGSVLGAFLGTFLIAIITNALTLLGVDVYWQTFVLGGTLLTAVLIDTLSKKYKTI
ncbi:ABC transporter permease [Oceanispirochaeta sp.]|jgi:ribose transport system permease protein|uniref:ABC transporter permease n=1 Tax=Oceanispirochaeta sp. TaxID=2035350 RepID=UPI00263A2541|nr:ABC transporter permease [Oceanispirochaeta sp.]MDA3955912.1 ABC transporter permease [Oceanispirochaeta sp.]